MNRPKWVKLALIGVVGVPATIGIQALPAVGQSSPPVAGIRLGSGRIADRGAVAFVTVHIACPAGDPTNVTVQLTERSGNGIAQGGGFTQATCNGNIQDVTVPVPAFNRPWVRGTAFGQGTIEVFDPSGVNGNSDARNVTLRR
jgi:hypothetical protein